MKYFNSKTSEFDHENKYLDGTVVFFMWLRIKNVERFKN